MPFNLYFKFRINGIILLYLYITCCYKNPLFTNLIQFLGQNLFKKSNIEQLRFISYLLKSGNTSIHKWSHYFPGHWQSRLMGLISTLILPREPFQRYFPNIYSISISFQMSRLRFPFLKRYALDWSKKGTVRKNYNYWRAKYIPLTLATVVPSYSIFN